MDVVPDITTPCGSGRPRPASITFSARNIAALISGDGWMGDGDGAGCLRQMLSGSSGSGDPVAVGEKLLTTSWLAVRAIWATARAAAHRTTAFTARR